MKTINYPTTWGLITLTLDDQNRAVELTLPHLNKTPGSAFAPHGTAAPDRLKELSQRFPRPETPAGTEFQQAVWNEIKKIPRGQTRTYSEIAAAISRPRAVRAVGSACGANPLPVLIPCHRVVAKSGLGGFGSGLPWKKLLLTQEGWSPRHVGSPERRRLD